MAGEMLAGAVIKGLVSKLSSLLLQASVSSVQGMLKRKQDFMADLKSMHMTLKSIEAVIIDAEKRSINDEFVLLRLKRLKEAAYEISDMFDDFEPDRPPGMLQSTQKWYKIMISVDMANRMKRMNKKLNEITEQKKFVIDWTPERKTVSYEELETISRPSDLIVGRRHEKEYVINILLTSNTYAQEINKCTIIHGLAGVGKTELAKLVFNDERIKEAFPQRAWVSLPQSCDVKEICRKIISVIENRHCNLEILESIRERLAMVLTSRCLIVLDNLWMGNLGKIFPLERLQGIIGSNVSILVTSRKVIQLSAPKATIFPLEPLSDKLSFDLVKQVASSYFREGDIPEIAHEIVTKCRGVPLALRTIASRLKPGTDEEVLSLIKEIPPTSSDNGQDAIEKIVLGSLRLTYRLMTPELKLCFAYCAVFAKGFEIDREELCHQWIALGLIVSPSENQHITENPGKTKRRAEENINELLDMSFLQGSGPSSVTIRSFGAPAKLKMHDLVHDLAKLVCDDELVIFNKNMLCTRVFNKNMLCTRGSPRYAMVSACDKENLHKDNKLAGLRALHIKDCPTLKFKWYNSSFAKRLRVLDISGHHIEKLPSTIGNLLQLRYLNASGIQCKELPKAIGTLSKLQYLNLHGSSISGLPDSVTKLDQLMHLDISDCKNLQALPSSFCLLKCLCFLSLKKCYQLCSLPDDLAGLQNLENLNLSGCSCLCKLPESLGVLKKLKQLDLSGCLKITKLPDSFVRLTGLQYLNISSCSELNIPVDGLNKLVGLKYVDMSSCPKLVGLPEEFCSLEHLHTLNLSDCSQLANLPEKLGQMKSIRFILLDGCAESVRKPILQHRLGAGLQSLPAFVIEAQVGSIRSNITQLEQEKFSELELYHLENVREVDEAEALKMPARSGLHSLGLMWTLNVVRFVKDEALLQALEPPENIQKFRVQGYMGERFPKWNVEIGSFRRGQLDELRLMHFPMCNSLPQLGQLANLKKLHLCRMPKIRRLGKELGDGTGALKNLHSFTLEYMENLEEWCTTMSMASASSQHQLRPEGFMFPSLQELNIYHCPRLTMIPCPPRTIDWDVRASSRASQQLLEKDEAMQSLAEYMGLRCPFGYTTELYVNGSSSRSPHLPSEGWKFNASLITLRDLGTSDCCSLIDTLLAQGNKMQCLVNLEISGIEDTRSLLEQVETVAYYTRSSLAKSWPDWFPQQPILNSGASPHFLVSGFASCALDGWIEKVTSFLGNLIRINLEDLPMCDRLPPLGQLPGLQELRLKGMPRITRIDDRDLCAWSSDRSSSSVFFPRLTKFVLNDMPNLVEWVITVSGSTRSDHCGSDREEFMFPKLVKLTIWNCPVLNLKPGLPRAEEWDINNSDRVITSSYDINSGAGESYDINSGAGELATVLQVLSCKVAPSNWKLLYHLPRIQNLAIISCHGMEALPESIQSLSSLQSLTLSKCDRLKHLPEWLGDLTSLHSLMVVSCPLEFLPGGMRRLSFLRSLTLSCCDRLAALPGWMGDLNSLVKITIEGCKSLKSLPQLNSLLYLLIDYNDELHRWCESGVNKAKFAGIKQQGFWLESHGRSNSYILPARSLYILWGPDDRYWRMHSHPHSRFEASMELLEVWWLEIVGNVPQGALPTNTSYDVYLVYKLADEHDGLRWGESCVLVDGVPKFCAIVSFVDQGAVRVDRVAYPVTRSEGWMELRIGEFSLRDDSSTVEVRLFEKTNTYAKKGLIIEGMEIRAKSMPIT